MTFAQAVAEICSRVNDPLQDTFGDRAEQAFLQAVCENAISEDTPIEEIQDLVVDAVDSVEFSGTGGVLPYEANVPIANGTLRVLDVFIDPGDLIVNTDMTLKAVSHDEIKRMKLEPAFKPAGDECFWYRVGNEIRFVLSNDWEGDQTINFTIQIINSPVSSEWGENDLTTDQGYSLGFLYRCIDNAATRIRLEIAGA